MRTLYLYNRSGFKVQRFRVDIQSEPLLAKNPKYEFACEMGLRRKKTLNGEPWTCERLLTFRVKISAGICPTGFWLSRNPGRFCGVQLLSFLTIFPQTRSYRIHRICRHAPHEPLGRHPLSILPAGSRFYARTLYRFPVNASTRPLPLEKRFQAARSIQGVYFFLRSLDIEIWDLFAIWCLWFGILIFYRTFRLNWFRIYFDVALDLSAVFFGGLTFLAI